MFSAIKKFLIRIILKLDVIGIIRLSDKKYLTLKYYLNCSSSLNLENPKKFNEKLQWLKLYDRNPLYTKMVDKYEAKKYVASIIGEEYIIPTLGVYENFDEINFDKLPNQFVIKCTHDSASIVICKDKNNFNIKEAREKINKGLKKNYYYFGREWPYKDVKPRIIIEKYMEDDINKEMRDYKFLCFNGEVKYIYVSDSSHTFHQKIAFFDENYRYVDIKRKDYGDYEVLPERPKNFELMKKLSTIISKDIPHVRIDFYEINGHPYFGEITFYTGSGFIPFKNDKDDLKLGKVLDISLVKKYYNN